MLIGSKHRLDSGNFPDSINIGGIDTNVSEKVRSLGVLFDQTLSMKHHLRLLKSKLINNIINIARVSKYLDKTTRMHLVHHLILSNTDFCNALFYNLPDCDLRMLQVIINSAARIVVGMERFSRERITPICIGLHILPVKARIKYKICVLVYKALNFGEPKYLADLLKRRNALPSLRENSSRTLEEPMVSRRVSADRAFFHCAPVLFNTLPLNLQNNDSLTGFEKMLKTYLFSEAYDLSNNTVRHDFKL